MFHESLSSLGSQPGVRLIDCVLLAVPSKSTPLSSDSALEEQFHEGKIRQGESVLSVWLHQPIPYAGQIISRLRCSCGFGCINFQALVTVVQRRILENQWKVYPPVLPSPPGVWFTNKKSVSHTITDIGLYYSITYIRQYTCGTVK